MSGTADKLRAKGRSITTAQQPATEHSTPAPVSATLPVQRVKPVRLTVDLSPSLHAAFLSWCLAATQQVGQRVTASEAIRVLVERLTDDVDLQRHVTTELRHRSA